VYDSKTTSKIAGKAYFSFDETVCEEEYWDQAQSNLHFCNGNLRHYTGDARGVCATFPLSEMDDGGGMYFPHRCHSIVKNESVPLEYRLAMSVPIL
jgi:hypothetical protein